ITVPQIDQVVQQYIAMWNEDEPARRRELVEATVTADATYVDPHFESGGVDGIDAMIAGVRGAYPGHRFVLAGGPDAHHDRVRFSWHLCPPDGDAVLAVGLDVATVAADGRLCSVTGFLEPAAA